MFDNDTTPGGWCGTGVVDEVMMQPPVKPDANELVIRKTKSSRSAKTEVYDADETVRSMRSGDHTRASNRSRTMRFVTPSASELFDSDLLSLKSNRSGDGRSKPRVRGLSSILGGNDRMDKPISPKSQRSSSSWRSDRSIRKYSDVERTRSNELDFDADRVVIPESILKKKKEKASRRESTGRIVFAPEARAVEYGGRTPTLKRQHSEQEEM
jgi:hypothetical protein